jgi:hypothetical protein
MLQGLAHTICVYAKKASGGGGGGGDVTPAAVNWATLSFDNDSGLYGYSEKQITGINETITLKVEFNNSNGFTLYYFVSSSASAKVTGDATSSTSPTGFSMNSIANNGTFTVTNNQYVTFGATISCFINSPVVTVKNQSDSNVTLDTFTLSFAGEC